MRKYLFLSALVLLPAIVMAVPAKRVTKTVRQLDGTALTVELRGDETFHYYVTSDGQPVCENEVGNWVPDTRDIEAIWTRRFAERQRSRQHLQQHTRRLSKAIAETPRYIRGQKKGLLILVNFTDVQLKPTSTMDKWEAMLNSLGAPYGKNYGSVREYFNDQSYGLLDVEFDIVGPVNVSHEMAYYGENENGADIRPYEMVIEACRLVDDEVNFADYDWDGDGEVENIFIIYAGYGEASGGPKNSIWAHQWGIKDALQNNVGLRLDDVTVSTYACGPELDGGSGSTIVGIGTMCHEYSHCLGLPDFYDTEKSINFGMGTWSLMDFGCYNNNGYYPCVYTAYERWFCGWMEPEELRVPTIVTDMPCISDTAFAYIVYNEGNRDEYYILENHQKKGWDKYAGGHGMLVLHVDYNASIWEANTINNVSSRQRMTILPADGELSTSMSSTTLAGDPFPGTSKKKNLTDTSSPAATLYNSNADGRKYMHKAIENITEQSGLISFEFMQDQVVLPAPVLLVEQEVTTATSLTAAWTPVEEASYYNLRYTQVLPGEESVGRQTLLEEDFAKVTTGGEDGETDIGTTLNTYLKVRGWTGSAVFKGTYGILIGSKKSAGVLTTPVIKANSDRIDVAICVRDFIRTTSGTADGSTLSLSLLSTLGEILSTQTVTPETDVVQHFTFTDVPSSFMISMETPKLLKRVYVSSFSVSTEVQTVITKIRDTRYTVEDLTPGTLITYSVQAVSARGKQSQWSEPQTITLPTDDAVRGIAADLQPSYDIWGLDGRRHSAGTLRRGVYVVNGRKVAIR